MSRFAKITLFTVITAFLHPAQAAEPPVQKEYTNSIGMKFVRITPGTFQMGQQGGHWDEQPVHKVNIARPFFIGATEVTNAQYEQFDPGHRQFRGRWGLSNADDEAVVFVSWNDAVAFCKWLSGKEGKPYRLPTEAEWEYACRAGTTTPFYTGDQWPAEFHKKQQRQQQPSPVSLQVAQTIPNPWGLYDMHGNVEEWCLDWYGPYAAGGQSDPAGRVDGDFKATRGGSHNTNVRFLRSANRQGALPEDKHWLIGFRVVLGEMPTGKPLPKPEPHLWVRNVSRKKYNWADGPDFNKPYFSGPTPYVKVPPNSNGPMFSKHNHDPALTWCDNGDLLAIWYSCNSERGRELCVLASRLRRGAEQWDGSQLHHSGMHRTAMTMRLRS
jgi:formylglycine-generating enzyme required for sulfatase activity